MVDDGFTPEQRRYLEGLVAGLAAARGTTATASGADPDAPHLLAMARFEADGHTLSDAEAFKREEHPWDAYERMKAQGAAGEYPSPADNFRWRFHGLFYVAPNQISYMCRLRIPNGIVNHWQMAGLALLARTHGGGYAHVTTRANLQIREITAERAVPLIEAIQNLGLHTRGSGADNIRNVTGSPTAGIDRQELLDTRPFAFDWHFHVLNSRTLAGLPRKFNVAFDGAGRVAALEETNDIGFQAVEVMQDDGPEIRFRILLGGITGHGDFARDQGVFCRPREATQVADAVVRAFIDTGDRTDRNKARLKYVLDRLGLEAFLQLVEEKLGRPLERLHRDRVRPRPEADRLAHVGVHAQRQPQRNWVGIMLDAGRLTASQMQGLADIARTLGDGDLRLTVWQNLLVSGIHDDDVGAVIDRIEALGLSARIDPLRAGLVACTGSAGCKFAAADTKRTAAAIAAHVERRWSVDTPVNIHLTGCHHSCAQHYIGDIGLIACKIDGGDDRDPIDGYHLIVGGSTGPTARIGRELARDIPDDDCPATVGALIGAWMEGRADPSEPFHSFAARHDDDALRHMMATCRD